MTAKELFEDRSHNLLGNLTGEIRITEPEEGIIHSICRLSLSSPRPDEYHGPYLDKIAVHGVDVYNPSWRIWYIDTTSTFSKGDVARR